MNIAHHDFPSTFGLGARVTVPHLGTGKITAILDGGLWRRVKLDSGESVDRWAGLLVAETDEPVPYLRVV